MSTQVPNLKLGHRRRAVYAALIKILGNDDQRAYLLFALFDRDFSTSEHFLVMRFMAVGATEAGLAESEKVALMRAIYLSLATPYEDLPQFPEGWLQSGSSKPEPAPERTGHAPAASSTAVAQPAPESNLTAEPPSARAIVFGAVARALLGAVRAATRSNKGLLGEMINDAVSHSQLRQGLSARVVTWCDGGGSDDRLASGLPAADLRAIVHVLYLAACDALGPVAADQLLSQSIMRAQTLPAAVEFSPDELL